jgi:hypothetical protein
VSTLEFGFVTSHAPQCVAHLEEVLYDFVRPPAQEDWIRTIRDTQAYREAREAKAAQLSLKLPPELVQALKARLAKYDKSASHELRAQVEKLPSALQTDYAALAVFLWATLPSPMNSAQRRTLYRSTWEETGLERNPLNLKTKCPNCSSEEAELLISEDLYLWELTCPDCGFGDRSAPDMPLVMTDQEPNLPDPAWSSWACCTSAVFADWGESVARRRRFLDRLRTFSQSLETNLLAELATIAAHVKQAPLPVRSYIFSPDACAVILARVKMIHGDEAPVRIHDRDADQLVLAQHRQGEMALVDETQPYAHWEKRFFSRLTALNAALDTQDPVQACVAAGQLLVEARYYGFLLPLRFTMQLPAREAVPFSELFTHTQHLATFIEEGLRERKNARPTRDQLEELIRSYLAGMPSGKS